MVTPCQMTSPAKSRLVTPQLRAMPVAVLNNPPVSLSRENVRVKCSAKMSVILTFVWFLFGFTRNEDDGWAKAKLASGWRVKPCFASRGLGGLTPHLRQLQWGLSHQPNSVLAADIP